MENNTIKQSYTLEGLRDLAYRAHSGTSFSPDKRAQSVIEDYSAELDQDLQTMPEDERAAYKAKYVSKLSSWLQSRTGIVSTMIAGASKFPVSRMEKLNRSEHNKYEDFRQWRGRALNAIAKGVEEAKSPEQKDSEEFVLIRKRILEICATIMGIDNGTIRGSIRSLFVSNLANRITTIAKNGRTDLLIKCLDLIKEINSQAQKPVISANHSIWKLAEKAEANREAQVDKANSESKEIPFEGGTIVLNYRADRLQIMYNEKPDRETITKIKANAFRWSPSNMAWQRQLTDAARHYCCVVTGISPKLIMTA